MSEALIRSRPVATGLYGPPAWEQRFMAPGPSLWPPLNSTTARFAFGAPSRMIYLYPASRRLPQAVNGVSGRRDDSNRKSEAKELERATLETGHQVTCLVDWGGRWVARKQTCFARYNQPEVPLLL